MTPRPEPSPLAALRPDAPRHLPALALPATRFVPGVHPHPRRSPQGSLRHAPAFLDGLPADRWADDTSWLAGVDLYHLGYLWEAHEAWEAVYFAADDPVHRDLAQALIQLAAAELNAHRGLWRGVRTLSASVLRRLRGVAQAVASGTRIAGVDPHDVLAQTAARFAPVCDGEDRLAGRPVILVLSGAAPEHENPETSVSPSGPRGPSSTETPEDPTR